MPVWLLNSFLGCLFRFDTPAYCWVKRYGSSKLYLWNIFAGATRFSSHLYIVYRAFGWLTKYLLDIFLRLWKPSYTFYVGCESKTNVVKTAVSDRLLSGLIMNISKNASDTPETLIITNRAVQITWTAELRFEKHKEHNVCVHSFCILLFTEKNTGNPVVVGFDRLIVQGNVMVSSSVSDEPRAAYIRSGEQTTIEAVAVLEANDRLKCYRGCTFESRWIYVLLRVKTLTRRTQGPAAHETVRGNWQNFRSSMRFFYIYIRQVRLSDQYFAVCILINCTHVTTVRWRNARTVHAKT